MDEKTPLIGSQSGSVVQDNVVHSVTIEPELPDMASGSGNRTVNCQVCHRMISLEGKQNQLVVKCHSCGEATPVKAAPPGKKYVRCPCNCLLICKSSSARVGCPRETCKRVITLASAPPTSSSNRNQPPVGSSNMINSGSPDQNVSLTCARCGSPFMVAMHSQSIAAKCPHCKQISSVGPTYARTRWIIFLVLGIIMLAIGSIVTGLTYEYAKKNGGIYVVYVGAFVVGVVSLIRSAMFCCMPVSNVEIPNATA